MCVYNSLFNLKGIFGILTSYEPSLVVQPGAQQKQVQVDLHQASQTPSIKDGCDFPPLVGG